MKVKRMGFVITIVLCMVMAFSAVAFAGNSEWAAIKPESAFYLYGSASIEDGSWLFGNPYAYSARVYGDLAPTQTSAASKCYFSIGTGTSYTNMVSFQKVIYNNPVHEEGGVSSSVSQLSMRIWYGSSYDSASEKAAFSASIR